VSPSQPSEVVAHCVQLINRLLSRGNPVVSAVLGLDEHVLFNSLLGIAVHGFRVDEIGRHIQHLGEDDVGFILFLAQ